MVVTHWQKCWIDKSFSDPTLQKRWYFFTNLQCSQDARQPIYTPHCSYSQYHLKCMPTMHNWLCKWPLSTYILIAKVKEHYCKGTMNRSMLDGEVCPQMQTPGDGNQNCIGAKIEFNKKQSSLQAIFHSISHRHSQLKSCNNDLHLFHSPVDHQRVIPSAACGRLESALSYLGESSNLNGAFSNWTPMTRWHWRYSKRIGRIWYSSQSHVKLPFKLIWQGALQGGVQNPCCHCNAQSTTEA